MHAGSKIFCSEGLTLGPQHFQLQDLYHESRLHAVASAMNAHYWGVRALQLNLEGLGHDRLSAVSMAVMFPDGASYDAPGADLLPEAVDLSTLPAQTQTVTFHLVLAALKPHGGNAEADGRYARHHTEALDLYSDALPIEVPLLQKQARLVPDFAVLPGMANVSRPPICLRIATTRSARCLPTWSPSSVNWSTR